MKRNDGFSLFGLMIYVFRSIYDIILPTQTLLQIIMETFKVYLEKMWRKNQRRN
ncbi:hypothetical protein OBG91_14810 [Lactococcus lactis]|nr:hypothetical protein [Lactococcus lactis]